MAHSGESMDLSYLGRVVDKHSTGGVADTTTLITTPLVAACGVPVAKMTGRGLGHTGGTVDKLESIFGLSTALTLEQFLRQVENIGIALISATSQLVPADKILYALRDVTATVDSVPLITSSIMSKKIASGASHIVLDVKCGSGAFIGEVAEAEKLAQAMVETGRLVGRPTVALLTMMDEPLGYSIGNALEVSEALRILKGEGGSPALREVSLALACEMLSLHQPELGRDRAVQMLENALTSGTAYDKFKQFVVAQGGDLDKPLPVARYSAAVTAQSSGYVQEVRALNVGQIATNLGAGRAKKEDKVDYGAGIVLAVRTGDRVVQGQLLATLYANHDNVKEYIPSMRDAISIGANPCPQRPLILKTIR